MMWCGGRAERNVSLKDTELVKYVLYCMNFSVGLLAERWPHIRHILHVSTALTCNITTGCEMYILLGGISRFL